MQFYSNILYAYMENRKGQLSPVDQERARVALLERQIGNFAEEREYFSKLPANLKVIAIGVAIEAIILPHRELPFKAGEIDALSTENAFARAEKEANGSV